MTPAWVLSIVLSMAVALWVDHRTFQPTARRRRGSGSPLEPATHPTEGVDGTWAPTPQELAAPIETLPAPIRRDRLATTLFTPVPEGHPIRRALAATLLAAVLWLGVFAGLIAGPPPEADQVANLGLGTLLFVPMLMFWCALGWAKISGGGGPRLRPRPGAATLDEPSQSARPDSARPDPFRPWRGLGLSTSEPLKELRLGLTAGVGAWLAVLATTAVVAVFLVVFGLDDWLPEQPASLVAGMAALPVSWRLAISFSAGIGEEIFFRGLLQPRIGLLASTALFALGHVGYGEPFLLLGVTLLSLIYGLLAQWRGNVWAAVVAHALFDAIQLLFLIPLSLEATEGPTALVVGGWIC